MPEEKEEVNTIADKEENQPEETKEETEEKPQKDRTTEQFEKLTKSNKELKQQRDKYKNVLESLQPDAPAPQQPAQNYQQPTNKAPSAKQFENLSQKDIDSQFKSMVDDKGYLDGNKLFAVLKQMDARTERAEAKAERIRIQAEKERIARQQQQKSRKMQDVHDKYPQLDPENDASFDPEFYELVRNDLIGQMMEGKEDPMAAADKWSKVLSSKEGKEEVAKMTKEEKEKKKEQKEQINAVRPRSSSMKGYYEKEEEDKLMDKVRKGKKGALAEAIRRHEEKNK